MRCILVCGTVIFLLSLIGVARAETKKLPLNQLPKAVTEAVKTKFPNAKLVEANSETEDKKLYYGVTIREDGKQIEVTLETDGKIESVAREIDVKDLPKAITKALKTKFPRSTLKSADAIYEIDDGKEKFDIYEVLITTVDKNEVDVKIARDGTIIDDDFVPDANDEWKWDFTIDKADFAATGKNPYFNLEVRARFILENGDDRVTITVLDETKMVDGVECRVVEERESKAKKLVIVSRKYLAINTKTSDIYYFGEDIDEYQNAKVVGHKGSWISGSRGAKFGLMMPGTPTLNTRYYQETAPKVAFDRAEIVSLDTSIKTPAGEFKNCLKIEETSPLDPTSKEYKIYAPNVGLVQDGEFVLVKYGRVKSPK